jgi:hypothetical protein
LTKRTAQAAFARRPSNGSVCEKLAPEGPEKIQLDGGAVLTFTACRLRIERRQHLEKICLFPGNEAATANLVVARKAARAKRPSTERSALCRLLKEASNQEDNFLYGSALSLVPR